MIYQICEFKLNHFDKAGVTLNKHGNKMYLEYWDYDGNMAISDTVDRDSAQDAYMKIVNLFINGMAIDIESLGIFGNAA